MKNAPTMEGAILLNTDMLPNGGLGASSCCDKATQAELVSLFSHASRDLTSGSVLLHELAICRSIYFVMAGWVALSKSMPEGQTQIIDFGLVGDLFDLTSADGTTASAALTAVTDVTVAIIPLQDWRRLVELQPEIGKVERNLTAARQRRFSERILRLGQASAEEKLAYAFLELGIRLGAITETKVDCFHIPLTQHPLGDFTGLTSVHISRTLRRMARNNLLVVTDHMNIQILDPLALAALAGISTKDLSRGIIPSFP
ncbi:MAG: Crp/Fnr family transcriptional regulator [Pseudorhodobacter sp.]